MFKNIGGKIKGLAKVLFVIFVIIFALSALVAAIAIGISTAQSCGSYRDPNGAAGFFAGLGTFILIAGLGFLFSWIGTFFTYGLGQLIEDTEINRKTNQQILNKLNAAPAAPEKPAAPARPAAPAPEPAPAAPVQPQQPTTWICPNCHSTNESIAVFCTNCGMRKQ